MIKIQLNDMSYEQDVRELLMAFYPGETFEYDMVYKAFGDKAKEEGFEEIGRIFHQIAEI